MHEHDKERPNRESNMEPAEGSRETAGRESAGNQGGRGTSTMRRDEHESSGASELPEESFGQQPAEHGGGISNRPIEEERHRQDHLPPRGERRENWKAD